MNDVTTFPVLTVDGVIFQIINDKLSILLIRRGFEPFKGSWALPGGYNPAGETTTQALDRVLGEKTGIRTSQLSFLSQLYAFDVVDRDPRGHAVAITYMGIAKNIEPDDSAPNAQTPRFLPIDTLPSLGFDHHKIVLFAREQLTEKLLSSPIIGLFLPEEFTFSALQKAYETILGKTLDKRNFRKHIIAQDFLEETGKMAREGAHRPARLYKIKPGLTPDKALLQF